MVHSIPPLLLRSAYPMDSTGELETFKHFSSKKCAHATFKSIDSATEARNHLYAFPVKKDVFLNVDFGEDDTTGRGGAKGAASMTGKGGWPAWGGDNGKGAWGRS